MKRQNLAKSLVWIFLACTFFLGMYMPVEAAWQDQSSDFTEGPTKTDELSGYMDGLLTASLSAHHVPGAVVVIVKDGAVIFSRGYGYADVDNRVPVDPAKTLFRPGSVSKLFTWTAVMQLVEQGRLDLNADVNTYLDFTIPSTYPEPITLTHLMTHTPGFEDRGEGLFKLAAEEVVPLDVYLKTSIPTRVYPPGEVIAYSNYGTTLAGYIVERVSGMPFAEYVEENIFNPLGMTRATFRQPLPEFLATDMAGGYGYSSSEYVRGGFEYVVAYPAGALSASGLEMSKFMIAHLQNGQYGGERILREETATLMHSKLYSPDPRVGGMAHGFFVTTVNGKTVISHGGDTILFHSGLYLIPEQNTGLFLSTNGTNGGSVVSEVFQDFMDHYYSTGEPPVPVPAAGFEERAKTYSGSYFMSRTTYTTFEKILRLFTPINAAPDEKGNLVVNLAGQTIRLVEVEPGLLVSIYDPDQKLVVKEKDGQVEIAGAIPFVFLKTPWYASALLHLVILGGGLVLFGVALVRWIFGALRRKKAADGLPQQKLARLARWVAGGFGLLFLLLNISLGALLFQVNPAYGVPDIFFNVPGWFFGLQTAQLLLLPLGAVMLGMVVIAWRRRFWTVKGRVFYTLLAVFAAAIVWSLAFWRVIAV